jgi:5-aminopentanamidase
MKVSVLELPASYGRAGLMLRSVTEALVRARTDLLLLPEAALTGYLSPAGDFDLTRFAEPLDGPLATQCAQIAKRSQVHLVAPMVLREGDHCFNAINCFSPAGDIVFTYRKRHPWIPETWATPGENPLPLVEIDGLKVTAAICFDVHFLEAESSAQLEQADLLLFASAWVDDGPEPARPALLTGLAKKFNLHVANANWGVGSPKVPGQGGSCIWSPEGKNLGTTVELA